MNRPAVELFPLPAPEAALSGADFQRAASAQGRSFEDMVVSLLSISGWTIETRHHVVEGVEIDIVAADPNGVRWWIECKGSWRGSVPGSRRGDTVKKAVGVAWYLSTLPDRCPYMLFTSHFPNVGTIGERMLLAAEAAGLFTQINRIEWVGFSAEDD